MKKNKVFNSGFLIFLGFTFFIGVLPLVLYPFSAYFRKQNEYEGGHGPLHQYPNGDYYESAPQGVDWLLCISSLYPATMMLILSLFAFIYHFLSKKYQIGLSYLIPALLSIVLINYQIKLLFWLFD
jgi:hypothetical protein